MKIVVDVPDDLLEQVRQVVRKGEYEDPREFVTVALANQVEIESSSNNVEKVMTLEEAVSTNEDALRSDGSISGTSQHLSWQDELDVLDRIEYESVEPVTPPDQKRVADGPLWGQYNRIFPVKLLVRALANELQAGLVLTESQSNRTGDKWMHLDHFSKQVSELARICGLRIQKIDENESRGRGRKLSAALPVGDDERKSKHRFKSHFVGYADQNGGLSGAAPRLLFTNILEKPETVVGITEPGLKFAGLWNPLLDGGIKSDQSLSEEESSFYLKHIQEYIPSEFQAMRFTAEAIAEGHNRPDSLSSRIATMNNEWSDSQANTVRTGLVSRMFELDLVNREQVGQRGIAYKLTTGGERFVDKESPIGGN